MPRLMPTDDDQIFSIPTAAGTFQFSGVKLEKLGASEYTLVTLVIDESGTTYPFADKLLEMAKMVVGACQKHDRSEFLMLRLLAFSSRVIEIHGFKLLDEINVDDYPPFNPSGTTALYNATLDAIGATVEYANHLDKKDYDVNGCVYVVTDGLNNCTPVTPLMIKEKQEEIIKSETGLESLTTIVIALQDPQLQGDDMADQVEKELAMFVQEAGMTKFINAGDATDRKLAHIAEWVSQSVSSTSQVIGSGGPSQVLQF